MYKIMTEAAGGLTSGYLIRAIQDAGHTAVATDIDPESVGRHLADDFFRVPEKDAYDLWERTRDLLERHNIDLVIPSLDETLRGWAERKSKFAEAGTHVLVSPPDTLRVTQDKWRTYQFFREHQIPTPETSLDQTYPLVKPRRGRGGQGVGTPSGKVDMEGKISQELVQGQEYTIDVFCVENGEPIYIVPRKRLKVVGGKSVNGVTVKNDKVNEYVRKICDKLDFLGPVNIQCFEDENDVNFIEINPRIGGGMALSFEATENWIELAVDHFLGGGEVSSKGVNHGVKMMRYYDEVFVE
jgi:carbamoyl-phosphate synthase large subunit